MKQLFSFIAIVLTSLSTSAQLQNPSFESWNNGDPEGWLTSNEFTTELSVVPGTPGATGEYCAELIPRVNEFGVNSAIINQAFAYGGTVEFLQFEVRGTLTELDTLFVTVVAVDDSDELLGIGLAILTENNWPMFQQQTVPIQYFLGEPSPAATVDISFMAITYGNEPISIQLDNIDILGISASVEEPSASLLSSFTTNDNVLRASFDTPLQRNSQAHIYSVSGQRVDAWQPLCGTHCLERNLNGLPAGIYIFRLNDECRKFVVH
jgi:hypothetical protein